VSDVQHPAARIAFTRPPAQIGIGDGLRLAARYWRASVDRWILPVVAVALASGLAAWLFEGSASDPATGQRLLQAAVDGVPLEPGVLPRLVAGPLAVAIVSLVAGWFLTANAIAGLRGRDPAAGWVIAGGLRSLGANILVGLVVLSLLLPLFAMGAAGLLIAVAALPFGLYVFLRLTFWTLALFDGSSIGAGFGVSWTITRRSVLRVIGWSLALFPIAILVAAGQLIVDAALGGTAQPLAEAIDATLDATATSFTILVLAVLYESQRGRQLRSAPVGPAPRSPLDPPPPPSGPWG
jgi:hypothetical protein